MQRFSYQGRDKSGHLRKGLRFSETSETLNAELNNEGISVVNIALQKSNYTPWQKIRDQLQSKSVQLSELAIFARQMQLLNEANVPIIESLKQLSTFTRSYRLANALEGVIEN